MNIISTNKCIHHNENNWLDYTVKGNSGCHSNGLVNYTITPRCARNSVVPLYVQDICKTKSNGCNTSYNLCVSKLTYNTNCKLC